MRSRLTAFLERSIVMSDRQYGFRMGKRTDESIEELMIYDYGNLNSDRKLSALIVDFKKVFDLV